jgi:hypothetical protein
MLTLEKHGADVASREKRGTLPYLSCDDPEQLDRLLGADQY